jgi:hypothetical protein
VLIPGFFLFSIFRRQKVSPHSPWCTVSIGGRYAALGVGFRCGLVYCLYSVLISPFRRYPSNNFRYCSFTPHYGSARESSVNVLPVRGILGCLGSKSPVMPLFYPFGISSSIGRKKPGGELQVAAVLFIASRCVHACEWPFVFPAFRDPWSQGSGSTSTPFWFSNRLGLFPAHFHPHFWRDLSHFASQFSVGSVSVTLFV